MISRQIDWSNESNLLYQILKQLTKLTSIIFGLKPKYKVYTALLTQTGTDAPVAIVLENTIGNISITYNDVGGYNIIFSPDSVENKIYSTIGQHSRPLDGQGSLRNSIFTGDINRVVINTQSTSNGITWVLNDDILYNTPIEIRVYN